jgi:hypothetical protein
VSHSILSCEYFVDLPQNTHFRKVRFTVEILPVEIFEKSKTRALALYLQLPKAGTLDVLF